MECEWRGCAVYAQLVCVLDVNYEGIHNLNQFTHQVFLSISSFYILDNGLSLTNFKLEIVLVTSEEEKSDFS